LSLILAGEMLLLAGKAADASEARLLLAEKIENGAGLGKLRTLITAQGGDARIIDDYSLLPQAACRDSLNAWADGYVAAIDTAAVGRAFLETGGGRKAKEDPIDYSAGMIMHRRLGDRVSRGEPLADVQGPDAAHVGTALQMLRQAIRIAPEAPAAKPVVLDLIR
jgi:pyrimidine-nucleoside phosphorylase